MKKIIIVIMLSSLMLSGCGQLDAKEMFGEVSSLSEEDVEVSVSVEEEPVITELSEEAQEQASIFVYVCGQVVNPGVYELDADSRVFEAIELAGGMTEFADEGRINLAQTLVDEQQVYIPEIGESFEDSVAEHSDGENMPGIDSDGIVNINTATITELMTLAGIGQTKAEAIISYREKNGNFGSISDIMNVEGIKNGTYEKIKDCITIK